MGHIVGMGAFSASTQLGKGKIPACSVVILNSQWKQLAFYLNKIMWYFSGSVKVDNLMIILHMYIAARGKKKTYRYLTGSTAHRLYTLEVRFEKIT